MPYISGGGSGGVASVAAADTSIVVAGTASIPTVRTATLDVIAADHPAAADWSNNSHKITGLANGTAATDAAAFGQLPAAPALVLLTSGSLGSDGSIDITSIPQTATDLVVSLFCRGTRAAVTDTLCMRCNNDSGSNYTGARIVANSNTAAGSNTSGTSSQICTVYCASQTAGWFSAVEIIIPQYTNTVLAKSYVCLSGSTSNNIDAGAGNWNSTAAISRLTFFGNTTANLLTGSLWRVYGRS